MTTQNSAIPVNNEPITSTGIKELPPFRLSEQGYTGIRQTAGRIYEDQRIELIYPNNMHTYKRMTYDPKFNAALNVIDVLVNRVPWSVHVREGASEQAQEAARFLNWCMGNMDTMSWKDFISEVGSYRIYGHHIAEKVYRTIRENENTPWTGRRKWAGLETRSQDTIRRWIFSGDNRKILGIEQSTNHLTDSRIFGQNVTLVEPIPIRRSKLLHFRWMPQRGNPEGNSPLKDCWKSWKMKLVAEEYEMVNITKNLSGTIHIGLPAEYMAKAEAEPAGIEAQAIANLGLQVQYLHAGEVRHIFTPNIYDDKGNNLFTVDTLNGSDSTSDHSRIIDRLKNEIMQNFLADVLQLGIGTHGSFALAESKNSLLAYGVQNHLEMMKDVLNTQLIGQTLLVNGWQDISPEDMPYFQYGEVDEFDLNVLSSAIQRMGAVGTLPKDVDFLNEVYEKSGFDYRIPEGTDLSDPDMFINSSSRSGDGMQEGMPNGTGNSAGDAGDNSVSNTEN